MGTIWVGVDPGKAGAIAAIADGAPRVWPMPVITPGRGRDEYDLGALLDLFRDLQADGRELFATVERPQPLPRSMGGGSANFWRGYGRGLFEALLMARCVPHLLVAPAVWQRAMHAGTSGADLKQRSIVAAQRLFPGVDLRRSERCRKADDGLAEALLIAEYGRRVRGGEVARG